MMISVVFLSVIHHITDQMWGGVCLRSLEECVKQFAGTFTHSAGALVFTHQMHNVDMNAM